MIVKKREACGLNNMAQASHLRLTLATALVELAAGWEAC